jgi:hypothetical protein
MTQIDASTWKKCVLCGKPIHPLQVSSALPLADGPCCVSCHYGKVFPTAMSNGQPSQWSKKTTRDGKRISCFVPAHYSIPPQPTKKESEGSE